MQENKKKRKRTKITHKMSKNFKEICKEYIFKNFKIINNGLFENKVYLCFKKYINLLN